MNRIKLLLVLLVLQFSFAFKSSAQKQFKVLLVTTTKGWHHESVHAGVLALQQMGVRNFFDVVLWEDPSGFTDEYLNMFHAVFLLNTTGEFFDATQQNVMERFIESGNVFVGVHSASDTEYDWEWYNKLVGRMFHIHPTIQTAKMKILDSKFPGLQGFEQDRLWTEEFYEFGPEKISGLNYVLGVDESTYNPKADWGARAKGEGMGKLHPLSWYHNYDGGRAFYTALGHLPTNWAEPAFLNHLYAGIFWAATGRK
jgi:type 1 glutamine amidotransferase